MRAQGGASPLDSEELNILAKRSLITCFLAFFHCFCLSTFLIQSRIITYKMVGPKAYSLIPMIFYPFGLGFAIYKYLRESHIKMNKLDEKYTPIWLEISQKTL